MEDIYDVIIAGAGFAGVSVASRIRELQPEWSVALIDKEPRPGGRLLSMARPQNIWPYGFNALNPALFEWLDQSLKQSPEADDLPRYVRGQLQSMGVLAAGKISEVPLDEAFSQAGGRAVAGAAAARDWTLVDELMAKVEEGKKLDQPLSQSWGGTRKSPSAIALEHLTRLWGIPDLWSVSNAVLKQRAEEFSATKTIGDWDQALAAVLNASAAGSRLDTRFETRILSADYQDEVWTVVTTQGALKSRRLVVAQNPWDALLWLPKNHWPAKLMSIPNKTKPASAVLLCEEIVQPDPEMTLPDFILIPAENVQAIVGQDGSLCFQATLNYELTLQAPAVVKAVKRLRRARKKLVAAFPKLQLEGDHIALVPVAWSQPLAANDRRLLDKLDMTKCQSAHLVFCGDAYGQSTQADQNLMSSVRLACESLCE
jgi:glycine/D-amino acid oxidase-like deaminating enzyme